MSLAACGGGGGGGETGANNNDGTGDNTGGDGSGNGGDDTGGDDTGDDNTGDGTGGDDTGQSKVVMLPAVDGYPIVSDIQSLKLNDDALPDLILMRTAEDPFYTGLFIQALINNGDRTFTDATSTYFPGIDNTLHWIERAYLVDLNGDSRLDIVGHVDGGGDLLPPLLRQESGEFKASDDPVLAAATNPFVPLDTDGDGDFDLLMRGEDGGGNVEWTLLRNMLIENGTMTYQNDGAVTSGMPLASESAAFVYAPAIARIDDDDLPDLVYGGAKYDGGFVDEPAPLVVLLNDGDNTFTESASHVFGGAVPEYVHLREMVVADFDGNGTEDIAVANHGYDAEPFSGESNSAIFNSGTGSLTVRTGDAETFDYMGYTHSADAGDIDADGDIDIVFNDFLGEAVTSDDDKLRILMNDGDGTFTRQPFTMPAEITGGAWTATLLADLDDDGYPEMILGGVDSGTESVVLWNDGAGKLD